MARLRMLMPKCDCRARQFRVYLVSSLAMALCNSCADPAAVSLKQYQNEEFGIQTAFPEVNKVCVARSGDHPIGFFAWLGRTTECDRPKSPLTSSISITAAYNSSFDIKPDTKLCRDREVPEGMDLSLTDLAFPGFKSVRCATRLEDDLVSVVVAAQAGTWEDAELRAEARRAPAVNYYAQLITTSRRIDRDIVIFRYVLNKTNIEAPKL